MAKYSARGTKLKVTISAALTQITQITSMSGPGPSTDQIEVTDLDNATAYREYLASFKDGGEVQFTCVWDPANAGHAGLISLFDSAAVGPCEMVFSQLGTPQALKFDGYVSSFNLPDLNPDSALLIEFTLKVAGTITLGTPTP